MTIRNNKLATIAAILTTALTLASCELETSDNGKFDGFWHLERVDTLATGRSLNLQQKRIFWGVQATRTTAIISASDRLRTASSPTRPIKTTGTRTRVKTAATSPLSTLPCSPHTASTTWKNPSSRNDSTAAQWC